MNIQQPIEIEKNNDLISDSNNNLKNNNYFTNNYFNDDEILLIILKDKLNNYKINKVLNCIKQYPMLSKIQKSIPILEDNKAYSLINKIKNEDEIQNTLLSINTKLDELNLDISKNVKSLEYITPYDFSSIEYLIKKNIIINDLQNKNVLLTIIKHFTNMVNLKINNNLLLERQMLLFLLIYLTGADINLLLEFRKTDIDTFFNSYKNNLGGLFFISNRKFNENLGQFERNEDSKIHLIKIKKCFFDNLIQTEDINNLIDIIYNKFVKKTEWYEKKKNEDYIFSLLSPDKKKHISKSNAIKDFTTIVDNLKLNSIIKSKFVLDDLLITTNFDNQDLNHFNEYIKLYKFIHKIYILIRTISNSINKEYKLINKEYKI